MHNKLVMAGLLAAGALSGAASGAGAATMVYVSNADSREISVLSLDENTGALTPVETVATSGTVMPLAVSPDRRHLYASLRSEPFSVSTFDIDPKSAKLRLRATVPLPANIGYLSTDRTGRFLLSASYGGDKIAVTPISTDGIAAAEPALVVPTRKNAHPILTDRANTHLFASNLGGDVILQFNFDAATGKVTSNEPPFVETAKGAGPRHFVFSPDERFVYSTNELDVTVNTYRYDAKAGTLALAGSVSVVPPDFKGGAPATAEIQITPNGRFRYASERTSNSLAAFRVDKETGALTSAGFTPTQTQPRGFNIDPSGKFLIAAGQKSNAATVYAINPESGALTPVQEIALGKNPNGVTVVPLP